MNILDLLHSDHGTVTDLLTRTKQANNSEQVRQCFEALRRELETHIRAEEGIFYPEVERIGPRAAQVIATALEQHGDAMVLLTELVKAGPDAAQFRSKLEALEKAVKQHIQFEETDMFRLVRQHFGNLLDDLGDRVKHREDALKAGGQIAGSE
jgi:iron-sulfur cluster repair protein YtfE (RIC family)